MEEITCPNCNVDTDPEELRRNNLRCPTCGFDLSDSEDTEDLDDKDLDEEELEDDEDDEDDEDEDEK